jgi:hypothetical protein
MRVSFLGEQCGLMSLVATRTRAGHGTALPYVEVEVQLSSTLELQDLLALSHSVAHSCTAWLQTCDCQDSGTPGLRDLLPFFYFIVLVVVVRLKPG